jgi:hypothetical protein
MISIKMVVCNLELVPKIEVNFEGFEIHFQIFEEK